MTAEVAIEYLQNLENSMSGLSDKDVYKRALGEAIETLRMQIPQQWMDADEYEDLLYRCPECWYVTDEPTTYCPACGQRLVTKEDAE